MNLIQRLDRLGVINKGEKFTLASGQVSDVYFDFRKAYGDPYVLDALVVALAKEASRGHWDGFSHVAGSGYGGVPLAAALSVKYKVPLLMVRDHVKNHGTQQIIEGDLRKWDDNWEDRRILVVDDVCTTGTSLLKTCLALGVHVKNAWVLLDRDPTYLTNFGEHMRPNSVFSLEDFGTILKEATS